jgi:hypothetical protein
MKPIADTLASGRRPVAPTSLAIGELAAITGGGVSFQKPYANGKWQSPITSKPKQPEAQPQSAQVPSEHSFEFRQRLQSWPATRREETGPRAPAEVADTGGFRPM